MDIDIVFAVEGAHDAAEGSVMENELTIDPGGIVSGIRVGLAGEQAGDAAAASGRR